MSFTPEDHINRQRRLVRVLETQHRKMTKVWALIDLETGDKRILPKHFPRERIAKIMRYAQKKGLALDVVQSTEKMIRWTVTAGDLLLYDDWSPYWDMTVVPYFPYFRRGQTMGMVEDLIDSQREINKRRSANLHTVMSSANAGWVYQEGSLSEDGKWAVQEEGSTPGINIEYKSGYEPPQRIQPAAPPGNIRLLEEAATVDIKEIAGINDAALGQEQDDASGRAVLAQQRQAVLGAETYFDNFDRAMEIKGGRYLDLIQNFYTEPRIIRTRGDDGRDQITVINRRNAAGEIVNNVTVGRYDVVVDTAPLSASYQNAQFEEALKLREAGMPMPMEVLIDLSSMPRKDEIKAMAQRQQMQEQAQQAADREAEQQDKAADRQQRER
jgi:hypothetical protein